MARSKSPACSYPAHRNAPSHTGSLYSDLLSGSSVNNVCPNACSRRSVASSSSSSSPSLMMLHDDFADVFGGPPKYSALRMQFSSQLSFKRGISMVSEAFSSKIPQSAHRSSVSPDTPTASGSNSFKFRAAAFSKKINVQRNMSRDRRKGKGNSNDEHLITAKDVRFSTSPSSFPPPSRPPPRMYSSDATVHVKRAGSFGECSNNFVLNFNDRFGAKDPLDMNEGKFRMDTEERRYTKQELHVKAAPMLQEKGRYVQRSFDELVPDRTPYVSGSNSTAETTPMRRGECSPEKEKFEVSNRDMERELKGKHNRQTNVAITKDPSSTRSGECLNRSDADVQCALGDSSLVHGIASGEIVLLNNKCEAFKSRKVNDEGICQSSVRVSKALEEKKQRDLQSQLEQAEKLRAGEILDAKIRKWAYGKEGNLRALLCTLQNILWADSGWIPVSWADLSTTSSLKKAYRKAALCVHPDKVQQRGASIVQKYIAEKVFDLLKAASLRSI